MRALYLVCSIGATLGAAAAQDLIIDQGRADRAAPGLELRPRDEAASALAPVQTPLTPLAANVARISFVGSSLPEAVLQRSVAAQIGAPLTAQSLQDIAGAVSRAYAQSDVALYGVTIPEQSFEGGLVVVQVREGHIATVSLSGETSGDIDLLRHYAARMTTERPLTRPTMERQLSLISDIPGLETRVGMSGADAEGGVRLGLQLDRRPWEYEVGFNNRGSEQLGETQVSFALIRNALLRLGDQTRLTLGADTELEHYNFAALAHRQPLGHAGASITGSFSTLETEPETGASGDAQAASIAFSYPLIRSYRRNLTLGFGVDGIDSDNAQLGGVSANEHVRAARASAAYVTGQGRSAWSLGGSFSQGLDGLGAEAADPAVRLDFLKLTLQGSYARVFAEDYTLRLSFTGQASDDSLPASERFTLGGAHFGRAFPAAAISGDQGYGAAAALAWRTPQRWLPELYVFADGGAARFNTRPLLPAFERNLASAGLGARFAIGDDTRLDLEAANALEAPTADEGDWRFSFGFSTKL